MRPAVRLAVAIAGGAAAGGLLFLTASSFMMALLWECMHRNPGDRFYCGETTLAVLPVLIVAAALLIAFAVFRWLNARLKAREGGATSSLGD